MARHNHVYLYASLRKDPILSKDANGDYFSAQVSLCVVQGKRSVDDIHTNAYSFDCPPLLTQDSALMMDISKWRENDIVMIKGTLCTRDTMKKSFCPHCGKQNAYPGTVSYIVPIHAVKVRSHHTKDEALEDLKANYELSNNCLLVGNVCENPQFYRYQDGSCVTQYNIALNRKFHIKTDPATLTADYPHVKSFGDIAVLDAKHLQIGSSILIEGALKTRQFDRKVECQNCGQTYIKNDSAMEIVPYSVEYLTGCRSTNEIEKLQAELSNKPFEDVFDVRPKDAD